METTSNLHFAALSALCQAILIASDSYRQCRGVGKLGITRFRPSDLSRCRNVDRTGVVHAYPDLAEMRRRIFSVSISDEETKKTIRRVYEQYNLLLEPHGAVGWRGLELYLEACCGPVPEACVCLETAHPAKFPDEIIELLGITPEVPASMKDLEKRTGDPSNCPPITAACAPFCSTR